MITYQRMTISLLIVLAAAGFFAGQLWPAEKKLPWQENWDKTVAAAKNEGQLTVYGSRGYEIHFRDFQKKYPDIKVTTVLGRGAEIGAKLMSERRAGKYLADIYAGGTNTLYLVLYQTRPSIQSALFCSCPRFWTNRNGGAESIIIMTRRDNLFLSSKEACKPDESATTRNSSTLTK